MLFSAIGFASPAQNSVKQKETAPDGWHLKDQTTTGYYGISLDKAYEFVKGKKSQQVVVAVIDSGIDTLHEDLRSVLWTNSKEIPGNGIDDDGNGYVDDVHGWNFLGGRDGRNVKEDSYEAARVYHQYKTRFENVTDATTLNKADQQLFIMWKRAKDDVVGGVDINEITQLKLIYPSFLKGDSVIRKDLGKEEYTAGDLKAYKPTNSNAMSTRQIMLGIAAANNNNFDISNRDLLDDIEGQLRKAISAETVPPNSEVKL
jgi:subtilisin family serine protease